MQFIKIRNYRNWNSKIGDMPRSEIFKKYQPYDQIIYTFESIIKNVIISYGCKLSSIFVDDKNTKKNS
jgi:hypothetical protein